VNANLAADQTIGALAAVGAARVSLGGGPHRALMNQLDTIAREVLEPT